MNEAQLLAIVAEAIREANDRKELKRIANYTYDPHWKARILILALQRQGVVVVPREQAEGR